MSAAPAEALPPPDGAPPAPSPPPERAAPVEPPVAVTVSGTCPDAEAISSGDRVDRAGQGSRSLCRVGEGRGLRSGRHLPRVGERQGARDRSAAGLPRRRARLRSPRPLRRRVHRADADAARRPARRAAAAATATTATAATAPPPPTDRHRPRRRHRRGGSGSSSPSWSMSRPAPGCRWRSRSAASCASRPGPGASVPSARSGSPAGRSTSAAVSATELRRPLRPRPAASAGDPRPRSIWSPTSAWRARSFATRRRTRPIRSSGTRLDLGARAGIVAHAGRLSDRLLGSRRRSPGGLPEALRRHAHAAGDGGTHARVLDRRHARAGGSAMMPATRWPATDDRPDWPRASPAH